MSLLNITDSFDKLSLMLCGQLGSLLLKSLGDFLSSALLDNPFLFCML